MTLLDRPRADTVVVALDEVEPVHAQVGYGVLGRRGALGYDDGNVRVGGRPYRSALSTHPPARVRFAVPAGMRRFSCAVALNDDVIERSAHAAFAVVADGRVVAEAPHVRAGAAAIPLVADVTGVAVLELVVSTSTWAFCHAVWLDPTLDDEDSAGVRAGSVMTDPLQRADLTIPAGLETVDRCIATAASAGFETWLDDLLASVRFNGGCPDARLVVFALDDAASVHEVAERHGAVVVRCCPRRRLDPTSKSVVYSVASLIPAQRFVCLDADMLVLDDLSPLFAAIEACPAQAILLCGEGNDHGIPDLRTALDVAYGGGPDPPFFKRASAAGRSPLVVNDGLLAGSRTAFLALERQVRELPGAVRWTDQRPDIRWRNQFVVNVALAMLGSAVELDPVWNLQMHVQDLDVQGGHARWHGRDVRVLHFSGAAKGRHGPFRDTTRRALRLAARPWRDTEVPADVLAVPSMLSTDERRLLYWLARHHVRGDGRIVDGGSFLGGSTVALAAGLDDRSDRVRPGLIAAYDRFLVEAYALAEFGHAFPARRVGSSFRPAFDANIEPWSDHIHVVEGDLAEAQWTGEPIEVLFLDVAKTWELNDLVLDQFLPCLVPGHSVIVQQDELWGYAPWIHLTMELLDGYVRRLDAMANGSVVYLLTDEVPGDIVGMRLREDLSDDRKRALMERAVARWHGEDRAMVELARVQLEAELDGVEAARASLAALRRRTSGLPRVRQAADTLADVLTS